MFVRDEATSGDTFRIFLVHMGHFGAGTYDTLAEAEDVASEYAVPVSVQKHVGRGWYSEVSAFNNGTRIR